jgi:hypothetical protein
MYEKPHEELLSKRLFFWRLLKSFALTLVIVAVSLAVGTMGYCYFASLSPLDGFLNASMILTGMGPVDRMQSPGGKLFSAFYALYSGIAFLSMVAVAIAPVLHRFLHRFHLDLED